MERHLIALMFQSILGLIIGGLMGYAFGQLQMLAQRRNARLQASGKLKNFVSAMPGSVRRVIYFVMTLVAVQVFCPMFFMDGTQWWVTAGVVLGYGGVLFQQLMEKRKAGKG